MKKNRYAGILAVLFIACFSIQGQSLGTWKSYMSYQNATLVAETPNAVFAVYDGSLLSYSPEDQVTRTYSLENGLNDTDIRFLNYCPEVNALLIIYDNSNMDIFMNQDNIYNLPDIKNNIFLSNKIVNNVEIRGDQAYLATGFGIVVVDLKRKEIRNTYRLDVNTTATCQWGESMYAATGNGLLRAALSSNLLDPENWENIPSTAGDSKNITKMVLYNDHLVFFDKRSIRYLSKDGIVHLLYSGTCKQLSVLNDQLVIAVPDGLYFYTDWNTKTFLKLGPDYQSVSSYHSRDTYWVAWGTGGLSEIKINENTGSNALEYESLVSGIKVNSPIRNQAFYLTFAEDQLLVTGGGRAGNRLHNPGTFMVYDNADWSNLDDGATAKKTGLACEDLMSAAVDPRDPNHYFVSSWGEGIYEFKNKELEYVNRYDYTNSTLQSTLPNESYANLFVRVDGMAFDRNNNLYTVSAEIANGLSILSSDGKWHSPLYEDLAGVYPNQIIITRDNKKWINIFRLKIGLFVLDDKGTIDNAADDETYYSGTFVDQENRSIGATTYSCLAEDLNGTVWVGTDNGPITFSSAEQVSRGECHRVVGVDEYGAGYYLLEGQKVTAIAVDGGNRKWIGTWGGGVFLVDQSGEIAVTNFNTGNSSIISDNINSVAINGKTGEVFFATDRGICSYRGDAIDGKPDYSEVHAFPNPVHPARNNQVVITGLMQNSRIKITDLGGNLMKEAVSNGGQYTWNCTTPQGEIVKAGIYLVFATLPDGSQGVVTKIMVIK
jgi:ligand-binding sensor domain-containing protein